MSSVLRRAGRTQKARSKRQPETNERGGRNKRFPNGPDGEPVVQARVQQQQRPAPESNRKKSRSKRRPEKESGPQIFLYEVVAQKAVVRESASHSSAVIDRLERGSRVKIDMNSLTGKRAKIIEPLVGWVSLWSAAGFILQKVEPVGQTIDRPPIRRDDNMGGGSLIKDRRQSASSVSSDISAVSNFNDLDALQQRSTNINLDMTSNPYRVGLEVEVFSKTKKRWLPGGVVQMNNEGVLVKYANKKKWFLFNSKSLRLKTETEQNSTKESSKPSRKKRQETNLDIKKDVKQWTTNDVAQWLSAIEGGVFKEFATTFVNNDIDGRELLKLTKRDLKELGIVTFGKRDILFKTVISLAKRTNVKPEAKIPRNVQTEPEGTTPTKKVMQIQDLLEPLPDFNEVSEDKKRELFLKKLRLCSVDVDCGTNMKPSPRHNVAKKRKREILIELVGYISSSSGWFVEEVVLEVIKMVSDNIFRDPPNIPSNHVFDHDDEEQYHDPNWPYLQLVYEFFHRFILSFAEPEARVLKNHLTFKFLHKMILTFNVEDTRERDYLKTILHRIYGKFMTLRGYIRKTIGGTLCEIIHANQPFKGVAELLEILGSIINGFAVPLKVEHKKFLKNVLVPLHKYPRIHEFHQHLTYCVTQFLEKDPTLCSYVLSGLIKHWPILSSHKEVLFLNEIEEILELTPPVELEKVLCELFRCLSVAMNSSQFQVAERALFLWNNDVIVIYFCENRDRILPIIYPALVNNVKHHWNGTVQTLTFNVIKMFMEMDGELFEKTQKNHEKTLGLLDDPGLPVNTTGKRLE